jgi:hypothetical protein
MTRTSVRYALRAAVLVAVVAAVTMLHAPAGTAHSPYLSALSSVTAGPAFAANGCPDKGCSRGIDCVASVGYKCIRFNGKGCTASICN